MLSTQPRIRVNSEVALSAVFASTEHQCRLIEENLRLKANSAAKAQEEEKA